MDSRAESIDKKIARLDAELRKYKVSYIPGNNKEFNIIFDQFDIKRMN